MEARNVSHVTWDKEREVFEVGYERKFDARWEYLALEFIQVQSQRNVNAET